MNVVVNECHKLAIIFLSKFIDLFRHFGIPRRDVITPIMTLKNVVFEVL